MRWLVLLLLLANLGFFALAEGWLAPLLVLSTTQQREPQRMAAQVAPERVRIVAAGAAAASAAAALGPAQPAAGPELPGV
ncbi:MAG: sporulation protein, partial [Burkholderiales bacterium]|nr:sporulation protein [Burkholderiales bacterium]